MRNILALLSLCLLTYHTPLEATGGAFDAGLTPASPRAPMCRLKLRGGAEEKEEEGDDPFSNWKDVILALEDMRRELKVCVEEEEMPESLSSSLFQCTSLQRLVITGGKLKRIPDDIGNLEELETLIISDNKIASLPPALAALPNLRVLEAERNELEELPRSDGGEGEGEGWAALEVINVANNRIADLSSLSGASKLNTLNADNNKLTEHERIPVTSWSRLKSLSLSGNELEQFPLGVGNLQLLEVIDLQRNRIKSLPAELGDLKDKTLRRLAIEDNPLEDKNRILKILNKGKRPIKEILEYVRKQSAATPSTASSSSSSKKAGKGQEVKEREDEEKEEEGKEEDEEEGKEEEGKVKEKPSKKQEVKKPKKMSRRQEAIWRKMQQEMNEKDKPATEQEEDPEASSSSSSSSAQEVDPAVLLGPIEADFPTDAFTGVKYKSEAELMVERGEARDVNHARRMIRDRLGMKNDPDTKHLDRTPASSLPAESKRSLRVKSSSVGRLIGTGGANIKNLQQEARKVDPHVQIDIREDRKDKEVHEVTVTGTKEATEFVVEAIKGRLKEAILAVI